MRWRCSRPRRERKACGRSARATPVRASRTRRAPGGNPVHRRRDRDRARHEGRAHAQPRRAPGQGAVRRVLEGDGGAAVPRSRRNVRASLRRSRLHRRKCDGRAGDPRGSAERDDGHHRDRRRRIDRRHRQQHPSTRAARAHPRRRAGDRGTGRGVVRRGFGAGLRRTGRRRSSTAPAARACSRGCGSGCTASSTDRSSSRSTKSGGR